MSLPAASAGERLAGLHDVAGLIASLAGERSAGAEKVEAGALDQAYDAVPTLAQAQFDELAERANALATAGIEALLAVGTASPAAIALLAGEIGCEIEQLERMLRT